MMRNVVIALSLISLISLACCASKPTGLFRDEPRTHAMVQPTVKSKSAVRPASKPAAAISANSHKVTPQIAKKSPWWRRWFRSREKTKSE